MFNIINVIFKLNIFKVDNYTIIDKIINEIRRIESFEDLKDREIIYYILSINIITKL